VTDRWAETITEAARAHWTPQRLRELSRDKTLLLPPVEAAPLLRSLSILRADGSIPPDRMRKYLQINHMVAVLGPSLRELMASRPVVRIVDAACGKSYLSLLLAWVMREMHHHPVEVLGVDRNVALIDEVKRITALAEIRDVRHEASALSVLDVRGAWARAFGQEQPIDAMIALHACDTATDDAIALGVDLGVTLIAVAPCCQAELARGWAARAESGEPSDFAPVHRAPHLRREIAASLTDAMRTELLRAVGYQVWPIEFVPSEHTPKNTLLRAMRRTGGDPSEAPDAARASYLALVAATGGVGIGLGERLLGR
jgi:hypothetical protein